MIKITLISLLVFNALMNTSALDSYSLTIKTEGLENSEGTVIFALYNKEGSLPDQKFKNYYKKQSSSIINKTSEITFNNLPQGVYAITIVHDENNNGKIDKKFMLPLPDEGVGFSNYKDFGLSNRPNFKNASFQLNRDTSVVVKVIYK